MLALLAAPTIAVRTQSPTTTQCLFVDDRGLADSSVPALLRAVELWGTWYADLGLVHCPSHKTTK